MRIRTWLTPLLVLVVLIGLSFAGWSLAVRWPDSPWYVPRWETISQGMDRMEFVSEDRTNILLYRFDPEHFVFDLEYDEQAESVTDWSDKVSDEVVVFNGFYFLEDNTPAGQMIVNAESIGGEPFDYGKSGAIVFKPTFGISQAIDPHWQELKTVEDGAQSFPFLIKNGQPAIKEDSGLLARRTFMGTDINSNIYVGIVWKDNVSLHDLSQDLEEIEVDWGHVLNLDGGPSTGIVVHTDGFVDSLDSGSPVPTVVVVRRR